MEARYEILGKIGQGGIGRVHRAYDQKMNRQVAIKRILTSCEDPSLEAEATKQMMAEIGALSSLQHPHIVTVYDVGADEEGPYVVMELIDGKTLDEIVENAPLTWDDFRIVAVQSLEALLAAHDLDMIHSDLKPPNIMLTWMPSGSFQIKIVDFGLATLIHNQSQEEIEKLESVYGSVFFMPPEQYERKTLDARADLYSLGCCFYQALAGIYPFNGETGMEVMQAHLDHTVRPIEEIRSDIPPWVCTWVMWMINRYPDDRPATAREALAVFEQNEKAANAAMTRGGETEKKPRLITSSNSLPTATGSFSTSHETSNVETTTASHGTAGGSPTAEVQVVSTAPGKPKSLEKLVKIAIPAAAVLLIVVTIWLMMRRNEEVRQRNAYNNLFAMAAQKNVKQVHLSDQQIKMVFDFILNSKPDADFAPAYQTLTKATASDGTSIDTAIADFATTAKLPPGIRRKLFEEVIGNRKNPDLVPPMIKYTASAGTPGEATAAFDAIRPIVREEHAEGLLGIIATTSHAEVRRAAESKMSEIIARSSRRNDLAALVSKSKEKAGGTPSREHFDRLLAQCGHSGQTVVKARPNPPPSLPAAGPAIGYSNVLQRQLKSRSITPSTATVGTPVSLRNANASIVQTTMIDSTSPSFFDGNVSATDLINVGQSTYASVTRSENTTFGFETAGNDGTASSNDNIIYGNTVKSAPIVFTFNLDTSVNTLGYDITSIQTIYGYGTVPKTWADQIYEVQVVTVGSPATFTTIATVNFDPETEVTSSQITLTDASGVLATGVSGIRLLLGANPENGHVGVIREFDVFGTATVIPEP